MTMNLTVNVHDRPANSLIEIVNQGSTWGGKITIGRAWHNPTTHDYVWIEAHECKGQEGVKDDTFRTAIWVPDGNDGDPFHDGATMEEIIRGLLNYPAPPGMIDGLPPEVFNNPKHG